MYRCISHSIGLFVPFVVCSLGRHSRWSWLSKKEEKNRAFRPLKRGFQPHPRLPLDASPQLSPWLPRDSLFVPRKALPQPSHRCLYAFCTSLEKPQFQKEKLSIIKIAENKFHSFSSFDEQSSGPPHLVGEEALYAWMKEWCYRWGVRALRKGRCALGYLGTNSVQCTLYRIVVCWEIILSTVIFLWPRWLLGTTTQQLTNDDWLMSYWHYGSYLLNLQQKRSLFLARRIIFLFFF